MDKRSLRTYYKLKREELTDRERETLSIKIADQSLKLNIWNKKTYHIYLSINHLKEINTTYIFNILNKRQKDIVVPKIEPGERLMKHYRYNENTQLEMNTWGIAEPMHGEPVPENRIDVVFIPLLGFDKMGNRLGYGKGYYDRFLQKCRKDCIKVGLSFFEPLEKIPVEITDVRLNTCITADKIYDFGL